MHVNGMSYRQIAHEVGLHVGGAGCQTVSTQFSEVLIVSMPQSALMSFELRVSEHGRIRKLVSMPQSALMSFEPLRHAIIIRYSIVFSKESTVTINK